jgi:hypothetical protein
MSVVPYPMISKTAAPISATSPTRAVTNFLRAARWAATRSGIEEQQPVQKKTCCDPGRDQLDQISG